jgi:hypothetical protein
MVFIFNYVLIQLHYILLDLIPIKLFNHLYDDEALKILKVFMRSFMEFDLASTLSSYSATCFNYYICSF